MTRGFQFNSFILESVFDTGTLKFKKALAADQSLFLGEAEIGGARVFFWGTNPDVKKGMFTSQDSSDIKEHLQMALVSGKPVISFLQSTGISPEEGVAGGEFFGALAMTCTDLSGKIPQICCLTGVNIGGAGYLAALHDIVIGHQLRSFLCVSGPEVVKLATGREETYEQIGGMGLHSKTGLVHVTHANWENICQDLRSLIGFIETSRNGKTLQSVKPKIDLPEIPLESFKSFDITILMSALVDDSFYWEYSHDFAPNLITAFANWNGFPVGVIANQSLFLGGALDAKASRKLTRFIKICDAYRLPIISLVDTPGFLPGHLSESEGVLQEGANVIAAMQTDVLKMSVVIRRCFGAAGMMLTQSRAWRGDYSIALDTISTSVMSMSIITRLGYNFKPDTAQSLLKDKIIDEIVRLDEVRDKISLKLKSAPTRSSKFTGRYIGY